MYNRLWPFLYRLCQAINEMKENSCLILPYVPANIGWDKGKEKENLTAFLIPSQAVRKRINRKDPDLPFHASLWKVGQEVRVPILVSVSTVKTQGSWESTSCTPGSPPSLGQQSLAGRWTQGERMILSLSFLLGQ